MNLELDSIHIELNKKTLKQMLFVMNALENGWTIHKKKELYIFSKKHEGKKEIFEDSYLTTFVEENSNIQKIIDNFSSEK